MIEIKEASVMPLRAEIIYLEVYLSCKQCGSEHRDSWDPVWFLLIYEYSYFLCERTIINVVISKVLHDKGVQTLAFWFKVRWTVTFSQKDFG